MEGPVCRSYTGQMYKAEEDSLIYRSWMKININLLFQLLLYQRQAKACCSKHWEKALMLVSENVAFLFIPGTNIFVHCCSSWVRDNWDIIRMRYIFPYLHSLVHLSTMPRQPGEGRWVEPSLSSSASVLRVCYFGLAKWLRFCALQL